MTFSASCVQASGGSLRLETGVGQDGLSAWAMESRYRITARYNGPGVLPAGYSKAPMILGLVTRRAWTKGGDGVPLLLNTMETPVSVAGGQSTTVEVLPLVDGTEPPVYGSETRRAELRLRLLRVEVVVPDEDDSNPPLLAVTPSDIPVVDGAAPLIAAASAAVDPDPEFVTTQELLICNYSAERFALRRCVCCCWLQR